VSLWAYDVIRDDHELKALLVKNTILTMEKAGQIAYLRSSGLTGGNSNIIVEIHYYRNRDQSSIAFHKDTVGETLFVNLNYLNKEEIAGPEYILNPRTVASHEMEIQDRLPAKAYRDLVKVRNRLVAPTKIKWAGNIPKYGVVAFTDELIHHATPLTEHRTVYSDDLKRYLQANYSDEYLLAASVHGYSDQLNKDIRYNPNSRPISKKLFEMANVPLSAAKYYSRTDLQTAKMPPDQIDELLDLLGNRGMVGIQGGSSPILDPLGNTKTLHRKISQIKLDAPEFPLQSTAPRSFFRTWVRAIRKENRRPANEQGIIG